ncbi:MAG: hypothetical protein AAGA37_06470 [Actinomycetota bacterium]
MSLTPENRQAYRRWLIAHDLQADVADAILETMPPFDWSNIARNDEMQSRFGAVEHRLGVVEQRLGGVEHRLDRVDDRLGFVETRLGNVEDGLVHVGSRIDALNHTFTVGGLGLIATLILGFASIFTAILLAV